MPKYGIINKDGSLSPSSKQREGFKPIEYEKIPEDFDQTTHYITQDKPIDKGDYIFVGIDMHELEIEDDEFDEDTL